MMAVPTGFIRRRENDHRERLPDHGINSKTSKTDVRERNLMTQMTIFLENEPAWQ